MLRGVIGEGAWSSRPVGHPIGPMKKTQTESTEAQALSWRAVMTRAVHYHEVICRRVKKKKGQSMPL